MNRDEATDFFSKLFSRAPSDAAVVVSAFPSKESICLSADNVEGLVAAGAAAESDRQDAYFSACCVGTDFVAQAGGRGKKADFRSAVALWADVDVRSPAHKAAPETLPPTVEDAAELILDAVGLDPTILVSSGHGLHAYWVLSAPVAFGAGGALSAEGLHFASVVEALQERIRAAAKLKGWHVDLVADVPRILRVPGTSNFKLAGDVRPVELVLSDGGPVGGYGFKNLCLHLGLPSEPARKVKAPVTASQTNSSVEPGSSAASTEEVLASVRSRLRNLRNQVNREFMAKVLDGESFAERGDRDRLMQRAASLVAFVEPLAPAEALAELFRASFDVWAAEEGATRSADDEVAKVTEKIARAQVESREKKSKAAEANARIKALMEGKTGGPLTEAVVAPESAPAPATTAPESVPPEAEPDTSEVADSARSSAPVVEPGWQKYSEDELRAIAADLGCSLPNLNKRWIIQNRSAYFVLVDGRYKRPLTEKELDISLPRDLRRAPVEFWIEKADGSGSRPAKMGEILRQHATVARTLVSSLSAQRSFYEASTETFTEAVCPVRPISPAFDQDVDDWLRAFFGPEAEKGLDWVATATDLERYTCALYLSGPPETGKTLFANGISRLWTIGGPSELGRILENFNEDLIRCPTIFADEHIPSGFRGQRTSTELRNLIGNNRRTLNRKFLPQTPLVGAIRLILAANNDRLLAFSEDLSAHDLEAVAERFLHVDTVGAQGFFRRFSGGKAPEDWVEGDTIAAHALWLRDNRKVHHEGRFLVSGSMSKMLSMLATSGRAAGVVEWIAKYLSASPSMRKPVDVKNLVVVGGGRLLVNTQAVADHFELFVKNDRAPTTNKVGRILSGLAKDKVRIKTPSGTLQYHEVNYDLILQWMAEQQVGDPEVAQKLIDAT